MPHYYKTENRVQQECVIHFNNTYPKLRKLLFAVPNGGARSIREGLLLKQTGVTAGVSDLLLMVDGKTTCFELKTEVGHQSKFQKEWQKLVEEHGFDYYIIRSSEQFAEILEYVINNKYHINYKS